MSWIEHFYRQKRFPNFIFKSYNDQLQKCINVLQSYNEGEAKSAYRRVNFCLDNGDNVLLNKMICDVQRQLDILSGLTKALQLYERNSDNSVKFSRKVKRFISRVESRIINQIQNPIFQRILSSLVVEGENDLRTLLEEELYTASSPVLYQKVTQFKFRLHNYKKLVLFSNNDQLSLQFNKLQRTVSVLYHVMNRDLNKDTVTNLNTVLNPWFNLYREPILPLELSSILGGCDC